MKLINKTMCTFFLTPFSMAAVYKYRERATGYVVCEGLKWNESLRGYFKTFIDPFHITPNTVKYTDMKYLLNRIWKVFIILLKYLL